MPTMARRAGSLGYTLDDSLSMSSPDPIALSPPTSNSRSRIGSPLRSASGNIMGRMGRASTPLKSNMSPSKTITMSTGKSPSGSPWKIKVTVEAQPEGLDENDENNPFQAPMNKSQTTSRTIRIPLRDDDASPNLQSRSRSKTPVGRRPKRTGTPVRRKRRSITRLDSDGESQDDSRDQDFSLRSLSRPRRKRANASKATTPDEERDDANLADAAGVHVRSDEEDANGDITGLTDVMSPPTHSSISPPATASPVKKPWTVSRDVASSPPQQHKTNTSQDTSTTRATVQPTFNFTSLTPAIITQKAVVQEFNRHHDTDAILDAERSEYEEDEQDEDIGPAEEEVGEKTMLESEEFSMVSLESVESARDLLRMPSPAPRALHPPKCHDIMRPSRIVSVSTATSTGEEHPSGLLTPSTSSIQGGSQDERPATPILEEVAASRPPEAPQSRSIRRSVDAVAMQRTSLTGQALQRVMAAPLTPPLPSASSLTNTGRPSGLLAGFSADTRKHLRDGLRFGESLARASDEHSSPTIDQPNMSVKYPRLPTPEGQNSTLHSTSTSLVEGQGFSDSVSAPAETRSLRDDQVSNSSKMRWRPSSPPAFERPTCISPDSMEAQWRSEREIVSAKIREADPTEVISISSEEGDSLSDMQPSQEQKDGGSPADQSMSDAGTDADSADLEPSEIGTRRDSRGSAYHRGLSLGNSLRQSSNASATKPFWQPGTALEPFSKHVSISTGSRRVSTGSKRADSISTAASTMPGLSPNTGNTKASGQEEESTSGDSASTPASPDEDGSIASNDTGLFWHNNLPAVYGKDKSSRHRGSSSPNLKNDKIDLSALLKLQTPLDISPLRTPGRGLRTPHKDASAMTTLTPGRRLHTPGLRGVLKSPGAPHMMNGSPLKSVTRVSFAEADETHDISLDGTSELEPEEEEQQSTGDVSDSMPSDIRQLYEEIQGSRPPALDATEEGSSNFEEVDNQNESSTALALSQSVSQNTDMETSIYDGQSKGGESGNLSSGEVASSYSLKSSLGVPSKTNGYSRVDATVIQDKPKAQETSSEPGLANRFSSYLWSYVQPVAQPASTQLSHPLLKDKSLSLLPRIEPWTKTHYKMLDRLYQRHKRHPELFDPQHPDNTCLAPLIQRKQRYRAGPDRRLREFSFADWIDADMKNWGFKVKLTPSLIVVAALFSQLLVLDNVAQYEQLVGKKINLGNCNPGTSGEELGVDKIVSRLFSIVHGEKVRRAEKRGETIERKQGSGWVRFKGSNEWINYM